MLTIFAPRPVATASGPRMGAPFPVPAGARGRQWATRSVLALALATVACKALQRPDPSDLRSLPPSPGSGLAGARVIKVFNIFDAAVGLHNFYAL